jgi:hypothetical protein
MNQESEQKKKGAKRLFFKEINFKQDTRKKKAHSSVKWQKGIYYSAKEKELIIVLS